MRRPAAVWYAATTRASAGYADRLIGFPSPNVGTGPLEVCLSFDRVGYTNLVVAAGVVEVREDLESFRTLSSRPLVELRSLHDSMVAPRAWCCDHCGDVASGEQRLRAAPHPLRPESHPRSLRRRPQIVGSEIT